MAIIQENGREYWPVPGKPRERVRKRVFCCRFECGCVARYQSPASSGVYCPNHAAELAPYVVLKPIEGFKLVEKDRHLNAVNE